MDTYSITLKRIVNCSVERAYDSWINPDLAKQWLCPLGLTVPEAIIEPKVGGIYRVVMQEPTGERPTTNGIIKELVLNQKLVFTWKWENDKHQDGETIVTLMFKPLEKNKTEFTMVQEQLKSEKSKNSHTQGWGSVFNHLEQTLGE